MTRIVAGELGGRRLLVPAGRATRPTSDRVREALFSALGSLLELPGARMADLYAGSGAIGFEALSRGCTHALFVESDPRAVAVLRRNVTALGVTDSARVVGATVERAVAEAPGHRYDLVFLDPPYAAADEQLGTVLSGLATGDWLADDAVVVLERATRSGEPTWVPGISPIRSRRYGETTLWYGRRS